MTIQELAHEIKSKITLLDDFKVKTSFQSGRSIKFFSNTNDIIRSIGIGFSEDNFITENYGYSINFLGVEKIIVPILAKHNIIGNVKPEERFTINKFLDNRFRKIENRNQPIFFGDYNDLGNQIKLFEELCIAHAKSFFNQWTSVESLHNSIVNMSFAEVDDFFGIGGIFKKAIVLKLNDNDFRRYMDVLITELEEDVLKFPDEDANIDFLNAAKELYSVLKGDFTSMK